MQGCRAERRTRRQTAQLLISPTEYRIAERIYDGDAYQIACELDVTLQVTRDYQQLLEEKVKLNPTGRNCAYA
ncbi:hypothetical protein [Bifidobacterium xylocopae]|uniref:HTH luxR-type domain-containing protein n=1 Tax=Bifidobacterium xylocopae TaxID=2493119 RepID=A0A366KH64_9BIFI|nr:hypothetical protein [Bifidobacterium xylocopae]RBQ00032.1 hypothetical protein CRD59_00790 [Bifidobacterium xylocopae]